MHKDERQTRHYIHKPFSRGIKDLSLYFPGQNFTYSRMGSETRNGQKISTTLSKYLRDVVCGSSTNTIDSDVKFKD